MKSRERSFQENKIPDRDQDGGERVRPLLVITED